MHSLKYLSLLSLLGVVVVSGHGHKKTMMSQLKTKNQEEQCISVPSQIATQQHAPTPKVDLYVFDESSQSYQYVRQTSPKIQTYFILDEVTGEFSIYSPTTQKKQATQTLQQPTQNQENYEQLPKCESLPQELVDQYVEVSNTIQNSNQLQQADQQIVLYIKDWISGRFKKVDEPIPGQDQYYIQDSSGNFVEYQPSIPTQFGADGTPLIDLFVQDQQTHSYYLVSEPSSQDQDYYVYDQNSGYYFPYISDVPVVQETIPEVQLYSYEPTLQEYVPLDHTSPDIDTYYQWDQALQTFTEFIPDAPSTQSQVTIEAPDLYVYDQKTNKYVFIASEIPQITDYYVYNEDQGTFTPYQPSGLPKCADLQFQQEEEEELPTVQLYTFSVDIGEFEKYDEASSDGDQLFYFDNIEGSFKYYEPLIEDETQYAYDEFSGNFYQVSEVTAPVETTFYYYDRDSQLYFVFKSDSEDVPSCEDVPEQIVDKIQVLSTDAAVNTPVEESSIPPLTFSDIYYGGRSDIVLPEDFREYTQQQHKLEQQVQKKDEQQFVPEISTYVQDENTGEFLINLLFNEPSGTLYFYNPSSQAFEHYSPTPEFDTESEIPHVQLYTFDKEEDQFYFVTDQDAPARTYYYYDSASGTYHEYTAPAPQPSLQIPNEQLYQYDEPTQQFAPVEEVSPAIEVFRFDQSVGDFVPVVIDNIINLFYYNELTGNFKPALSPLQPGRPVFYFDDASQQYFEYHAFPSVSIDRSAHPDLYVFDSEQNTVSFVESMSDEFDKYYYYDQTDGHYYEYIPPRPYIEIFSFDLALGQYSRQNGATPNPVFFYDAPTRAYFLYSPPAPPNPILFFFNNDLGVFEEVKSGHIISPENLYYFYDDMTKNFYRYDPGVVASFIPDYVPPVLPSLVENNEPALQLQQQQQQPYQQNLQQTQQQQQQQIQQGQQQPQQGQQQQLQSIVSQEQYKTNTLYHFDDSLFKFVEIEAPAPCIYDYYLYDGIDSFFPYEGELFYSETYYIFDPPTEYFYPVKELKEELEPFYTFDPDTNVFTVVNCNPEIEQEEQEEEVVQDLEEQEEEEIDEQILFLETLPEWARNYPLPGLPYHPSYEREDEDKFFVFVESGMAKPNDDDAEEREAYHHYRREVHTEVCGTDNYYEIRSYEKEKVKQTCAPVPTCGVTLEEESTESEIPECDSLELDDNEWTYDVVAYYETD